MAPLDRTYRLNAKLDFENNASAEIASVSAELSALNQQIESMDSTINVRVDVDTAGADAKLDNFERRLADVSGGRARLDLNTRPAHDALDRIERRLIAFAARTYRATVSLNVNGLPGVIAANAALRRIPARRTSTVNVNADQGIGALRRFFGATQQAASGGQFLSSVLSSRVFGVAAGVMIAALLAALPLLGPLAAGLTVAATTAGSAALGFGLVGGAIFRMIQGIKDGEAGFEGITAAIDEFKASFMSAFLPASLEAARFGTQIIGIGTRAMPLLGAAATQAVLAVEQGFNRAWDSINRNNRVLNNFKQVLGDTRPVMRLLTEAATHFGAGFIGFLAAASPQIIQFATYIRDIARRFSEWANSAQGRAQIQQFLRSAAPIARALAYAIWTIGGALVDLGNKHSGTAARGLRILADIIVFVIRVVGRILDVVDRLIRAWDRLSPATRRNILSWGALVAQIVIARAAIGVIIGILGRLIGAFTGPLRVMLNFTRGLLGFRRATGGAATAGRILRTVLSALFSPIRTLQAAFARLVTIKWRIADAARRAGTAIRSFFGGAINFVRGLITGFNNLLLRLWGAFSRGIGRIRDLAAALRSFLGAAFRAASQAASSFINFLGRVWTALGRGLAAVRNFAATLRGVLGGAIRWATTAIANLARIIGTSLWSGVQAAGRAIMSLGRFLGPYIMPIVRALGQGVLWLGRVALMGLLSPIGMVIAIVATLVAGFVWAYRNVEWFRDGVDSLGKSLIGTSNYATLMEEGVAGLASIMSDANGISYLWTDGLDNLINSLSGGEDSSYEFGDASYYAGEAMTDSEGISWIWTAGLDNVIASLSDGTDTSYEFGDASYYVGQQMSDAEGISWLWTAGLDNVISSLSEGEDSSYEMGDASYYVGEAFTDAEGLSYLWTDALGDLQSALSYADEYVTALASSIGGWLTDAFNSAVDTAWSMAEGVVAAAQWMYNAVVGSSIIPDMVNESIDWLGWWNEQGSEQATSLADTAVAETMRMIAAWNEAYEAYANYQSYLAGGAYTDVNRIHHMTNGQQIQLRDNSQDSPDVKQWNNLPDDWRAYYYKMDLIPQSLRDNTFYEDYSVQNDKIYKTIIEPYDRAYDTVVGRSIVPDMVKGVNRWLEHMADQGDRSTRKWADNVARNFEAVGDAESAERTLPQIRGLDDPFKEVRNDFSDSFGDITKVGETEFERLREIVVDQTSLMRRATRDETEDLYRDMDRIFKSTFESGDQNFRLLRQNSTQQVAEMGNETSRQMDDTSRKMIQSLTEAQQQGNAQLSTLRSYGGATMRAADPEFRYPIGEAASGVQQYLNDMLYGMAQVIDAASLNLTPPKEFQVRLSGAAEGGHAGETAADWGMLSNFIGQNKVSWDDGKGGVSGPGHSYLHWWGEGEDSNSTEYYIVHGRQENRPIVEAAAHSLGLGVHEHVENDEEMFHPRMMNLFANGGLRGFAHGYTMWEDMWDSRTAQIARQTESATGAVPNTYSTHPDGYEYRAPYSIDWWGGYGRGDPIGEGLGNEVLSYVLSNFASELSYWIWNYNDSWGGSVAAYDSHWDHVHGTFMGAGSEGPGAGSGAPRIDIQKMIDTYMPSAMDFGTSLPQQEATEIGQNVRDGIIEAMKAATGASYDPNGSVMDWIKQGVLFGNVFDPNDQGVLNTLYGRAMQESTGNPLAVNDWDINAMNGTPSKGLFQIIGPTWETHRAMYGEDAGAFEPNWSNPVLSTGVATRYMDNVYGGPVGSGGGGYTNGGIATAMQMALVAEKGPELFIPLHDTRAVQLLFDQIVSWRGAEDMNEPVVQRFEAEQAVTNARQTSSSGPSNREIRRLGDRLESALSRQVDARITNVEEMVDVAVEAAVGAQESPAGRDIQARNRAREYQSILDRRR